MLPFCFASLLPSQCIKELWVLWRQLLMTGIRTWWMIDKYTLYRSIQSLANLIIYFILMICLFNLNRSFKNMLTFVNLGVTWTKCVVMLFLELWHALLLSLLFILLEHLQIGSIPGPEWCSTAPCIASCTSLRLKRRAK